MDPAKKDPNKSVLTYVRLDWSDNINVLEKMIF